MPFGAVGPAGGEMGPPIFLRTSSDATAGYPASGHGHPCMRPTCLASLKAALSLS